LKIRGQAAPRQLLGCRRTDRGNDHALEAAPDVRCELLLLDDLPEMRKLNAGRENDDVDLAAGQRNRRASKWFHVLRQRPLIDRDGCHLRPSRGQAGEQLRV
jgi:hypothetical protein